MTEFAAAEAFLQGFHERHPYATWAAFADARTPDGRSSYDLLLDDLPASGTALDLGCGDGHLLERIGAAAPGLDLVGVDMTAVDLERAAARPGLSDATLLCERAQSLSLADGSVDAVRSHLALMLMANVEEAIAEIARVLRPGGTVAAVVGAGLRDSGGALQEFIDAWRPVWKAEGARSVRFGNRLWESCEVLAEAFATFTDIEVEEHVLEHPGGVDASWQVARLMYNADLVSEDGLRRIEADFRDRVAKLARPDGTVPTRTAIRLLRAVRP